MLLLIVIKDMNRLRMIELGVQHFIMNNETT